MIFIYAWFGISAFVIVTTIIQWFLDGCLIHEGEDRFYYLKGLLVDCAMTVLFGPVVFWLQWMHGNLIPRRKA